MNRCNRVSLLLGFSILLSTFACRRMDHVNLPNIIIINVDDMGWRDVGFMGSQFYETPNIDKLASLGMRFSNGYAAAANCSPSRACLMTGRWPTSHGIYTVGTSERGKSRNRKIIPVENKGLLDTSEIVLPATLKNHGYTTIHAGKWHLGEDARAYGFDVNIGGGSNGHPKSYYPPYGNVALDGQEHLTDEIMNRIITQLTSTSQPFFLNYAPYAVHTPIQAVESYLPKYRNKTPSNDQNNTEYASMIEHLDHNIGKLMSALTQGKMWKNTLLIFTSDNGGFYGITNQHPLRAGKGSYYEGGIRVPFLFVWNEKIEKNTQSHFPITNLDIFPTILSCLSTDQSALELHGSDLSPILFDHAEGWERSLFWHFPIYLEAYRVEDNENRDSLFRTRPGSVIRKDDWKLHYYFENNEIELYNLESDLSERQDLANVEVSKKEELLSLLQEWWASTNVPIPEDLNPGYIE